MADDQGWLERLVRQLRASPWLDPATAAGALPKFPTNTLNTLPTATEELRGRPIMVYGASGVADALYVCVKSAADTYSWVPVPNTTAAIQALIDASTLGGELGGTVASATVDSVHSGSAHASLSVAMPEFIEAMYAADPTSSALAWPVANQAYLIPARPVTADVVATGQVIVVTTQSGNIDAGWYSFDGTTFTRLTALGSTACPAASQATLNLADVTLARGTRYFFGFAADNGTAAFRWISGSASNPSFCYSKTASFPLPSTFALSGVVAAGAGHLTIYGNVSGAQAL